MSVATTWPLSALLVWLAAWLAHLSLRGLGSDVALAAGAAVGVALALLYRQRWRRLIAALGFPVSVLLLGWRPGGGGWIWSGGWLLALALLWWLYPRRAWSEAPVFPTPRGALTALPGHAPLPSGARVLDAGCGAGDGLRELLGVYPRASVEGVEWSRPLALLARWRAAGARVRRGDLWADDWAPFAMVYVFQRPESMQRVWDKACAELAPEAWLVSLDFAVPEQLPVASWQLPGGQNVWLYRPGRNAASKTAN
ncbi:class I SAM-dependent methyltransferase [Roseateles sp.]|uniref:class I SAM-dependent methyltransferase n=1 Tax=Roseateles sp. TaxID=1971397 RepID=UPI0039EC4380